MHLLTTFLRRVGRSCSIRRSALPIDRILPFLAVPPRIYETFFPTGFDLLQGKAETTISLVRSNSPHDCDSPNQSPYWPPSARDKAIESDEDDEEWIDIQDTKRWVATEMHSASLEWSPPINGPNFRSWILPSKSEPRSHCMPQGCVLISLVPQKHHAAAVVSYTKWREEARRLEKQRRVISVLNEWRRGEEEQQEDDWVLVS